MKKIHSYIMLLFVTLTFASCSEDEIVTGGGNDGKLGDDVQLGLTLGEASRTIYGDEENYAFPVYWSEGDKVIVASPQCADGRNIAEYEVTPIAGKSQAEAVTKTGEYGVQWGTKTTADFYSIYPSQNVKSFNVKNSSSVSAIFNIAAEQEANLRLVDGVYQAADMDNVIMYAIKKDASSSNAVNLTYIPYSTVLDFELGIGPNKDEQGNTTDNYGSVKIVSITLTAPSEIYITGDFTLNFNDHSVAAAGNNSSQITCSFATQPVLDKTNKTLSAKLALIPLSTVSTVSTVKSLEDWTLTVEVLEGNATTSTKKNITLGATGELVAGKIHKITLPKFSDVEAWTYSLGSWMTSLYDYKKIYLTELSIPGAWYAAGKTEEGYQTTTDIATLWTNGVRAFGVETKATGGSILSANETPDNVVVSGTGSNSDKKFSSGTNSLYKTAADNGYVYKPGYITWSNGIIPLPSYHDAVTITDVMNNIITTLQSHQDEFAVLVLSYADAGEGGRRYIDYGAWLSLVYNAYNSLSDANKKYIYGYDSTEEIKSTTTVEDVLGKLIIKVNVDANIAKEGYIDETTTFTYGNNLPALFSYTPFVSQIESDEVSVPLFSTMYWKKWEDTYRSYGQTSTSSFNWCFSSANRTSTEIVAGLASYDQRKDALRSMITQSKTIYESSSTPNTWFYFNVGGAEATEVSGDTDPESFAKTMNSWLYDIINLKANGGIDENAALGTEDVYYESDPSPLGIVMFNQCTNSTYKGPEIIKAIVEMNNKFKLKHASTTTTSTTTTTTAQTAAEGYSMGVTDSGKEAF